jgi:hypothetical protein
METNIAKRKIESTFTAEKQNFTIEASAKAFQILSSNLYTDKPLAIVRELSANALDAHKQANEERPFSITLPNRMNPSFEIRDYGIGMSPDTIQTLYTRFFGSDKNEDNEAIGGLGLGSKTPFSYTDTFTLLSYWEGIKYTWLCMIQEDGQPSISMVDMDSSDEDRGIQYIIPVKQEDFYTFSTKTKNVLQYFPKGSYEANDIEVSEVRYSLKQDEYGFRDTSASWPRVIMGPIAYRLDKNALDEKIQIMYKKLLSNGRLDIFCGIGDIDIQASREALSYDKKSQKQIIQVLQRVTNVIADDIISKIKFCKTYLEACTKGVALAHQADAPFDKLMWRGTKLVRNFDFNRHDGCVVVSGQNNLTKSDALSLTFSKYGHVSIEVAEESIVLYYDQTVSHNKLRLKTALLKDRTQRYIVFNSEQDMYSFQAATQRMDNISTADLPMPEKDDVTYASISRSKVQLKMRKGSAGWYSADTTIDELNKLDNTCWAPLSGGGAEPWTTEEDRKAYELLCRFHHGFQIIGVPKSLSRKAKHLTLMPIQEYARAAMINYIDTEERYYAAFVARAKTTWLNALAQCVDKKRWSDLDVVQEALLWHDTQSLVRHTHAIHAQMGWTTKMKTDKQIETRDKPRSEKYKLLAVLDSVYSYSGGLTQAVYAEAILTLIHRRK